MIIIDEEIKMQETGNEYIFCGSPNFGLFEGKITVGFDGFVRNRDLVKLGVDPRINTTLVLPEDRKEFAEHMMNKWAEWADIEEKKEYVPKINFFEKLGLISDFLMRNNQHPEHIIACTKEEYDDLEKYLLSIGSTGIASAELPDNYNSKEKCISINYSNVKFYVVCLSK